MDEAVPKTYTWQRETSDDHGARTMYLISSVNDLLDHDFINTAFASPEMSWATPLQPAQLQAMLAHSQIFGLYRFNASNTPDSSDMSRTDLTQIGMARYITDYVTTLYLTDVYILPECRGTGLGRWLIQCCNEVAGKVPHLRRIILHAHHTGKAFYAKELGVWDAEQERENVVVMTKKSY